MPINGGGGDDDNGHKDGEGFDNIDAFGSWKQVPIMFVRVY